ncbi:MAG TPA: T9SS type A sorting domain-containing protein [Saprospiraceae bacterium]|nr:T9SS type A sorting domain-containing protein [Saprospiraceae bacterium]
METPKYHLKSYALTTLLLFAFALSGFSQSPSLTIDYEQVVCIKNNDPGCRAYVEIVVNATNFCPGVEIVQNSPLTSGEDPSGIYVVGSYSFEVTASDTCGNELTETVAFEVVDCQPPTAICTYGLSIGLLPGCNVPLDGFSLNAGSDDNCSEQGDLEFEIARVDSDGGLYDRSSLIAFGPEDVGNQRVALIVTDEADNEAICETVVQIQCADCRSACENQDTTREERKIQGSFYTLGGYEMEAVELFLGRYFQNSIGTFDSPFMYDLNRIDSSGGFGMLIGGLCAEKTDDVGNGVSTIDLVMMRRAILQFSTFDAVQNIAGDVNGDQKISTRDMLEIRQVILQTANTFSGVPSWMMFRSDFDFGALAPEPWSDPLSFDLEEHFCYGVNLMFPNSNTYDFIGLKMGDVTGDAGEDWARSGEPIGFHTENKVLNAGSVIELPFHTNTMDLLGYQMTLEFDADALELLSWSGELEDYNINTAQAEQGLLAISRVAEGSRSNQRFSLKFAVKENTVLSEVLWLSDAITRTEGYTDLESRRPIRLVFDEHDREIGLTAYPNPFVDQVALEFNIDDAGDYQLELFNAQGQVVYSQNWNLVTGKNSQILEREELNATAGWYLARISGPQGTETVSLILK